MSATLSLENKVAIITGAASGIGRAIANTYLEHGAKVFLVDLPNQERTSQFETGESIGCLEKDITDNDAPEQIVARCIEQFGRLDLSGLVRKLALAARQL